MQALSRRLAALAAALVLPLAQAQPRAPSAAPPPDVPSIATPLDGELFLQVFEAELALREGDAGHAYELMVDAARRTRGPELFRRAVEIALQARAGDRALAAAQAWRVADPKSSEALRYQMQLLVALNRSAEAMQPLRELLAGASASERPAMLAALPRLFQRAGDRKQAASQLEQALQPWLDAPATRTVARVALARTWFGAGDVAHALTLVEQAQADDPGSPQPVLLALDMLGDHEPAERVVLAYLRRPDAEPVVRLAYVRTLTERQRYNDALAQLQQATRLRPNDAPPWLSLGALYLDLRQAAEAEQALLRYTELVQAAPATAVSPASADSAASAASAPAASPRADSTVSIAGDGLAAAHERGLVQAWLLLAQAAEQRGDFAGAERWLQRVDNPLRALEVQARRASLLVRQQKVDEARELIRRVPERNAEDARAKLLAEAQVMREARRWNDAHEALQRANERFPADADLLYEQAMMAEKLARPEDMEQLLRRVIELKPEHQHAYNALGYSLADRNQRLPEARELIRKALELAPGDPFITDSLGWVEFRLGNRAEALRLLRRAWTTRPDTEIAAHLGEVLWADGQFEEARRVWRDARSRDADNDVLRETLARLKVDL